jgi:hypothetical protein
MSRLSWGLKSCWLYFDIEIKTADFLAVTSNVFAGREHREGALQAVEG